MKMATFHIHKHSFLIIFVVLFSFHRVDPSSYDQDELNWLDDKDDEINMFHNKQPSVRACNFTQGKWIYDQTYPLYDATCPYLSTAVTCRKNGRPDSDYEKWRWKPYGCSIPRYTSRFLLAD